MKKLSKMTLLHVEKMSDSEMKLILGGNSLARLSGDNCYEEYISIDPLQAKCSGYCAPYRHYDSSNSLLVMQPRTCKRTIKCECVI
ncbi:TIGR04149 family rSAM-modified RiPP, partial [Bacteroides caecimuris]